ncbi:hypothetical protein PV325_004844 [Microctonus aethiopoides]|nr:hypothetical protein PV325_004844 [Microctonus aethiopoides]
MGSGMIHNDVWSPGIRCILPAEEEYEEDETFVERLTGLTEMLPEGFRNFGYNFGIFLSSKFKSILFAPMIIEVERTQMEELQRSQQKQVLLGPNATMSHMTGPGMAMAPPIQR